MAAFISEDDIEQLVQDWFRDQQTQKTVRSEIERVLDEGARELRAHVVQAEV